MAVEPTAFLGPFAFTVENGTPQSIARDGARRWVRMGRITRKPTMQDVGPDLATWRLEGTLFPGEHGRQATMDELYALMDEAEPQMFTRGDGKVLGKVVIMRLNESRQLMEFGGLARRIPFTIELQEYGEDQFAAEGSPLDFLFGPNAPNILENLPDLVSGGFADWGNPASWDPGPDFDISATGFMADVFSPAVAPTVGAARAAGIADGQMANIISGVKQEGAIGNLPGVMGGMGVGVEQILPTASDGWLGIGVRAAGLIEAAAGGNAGPAIGTALQALRPAAAHVIGDIFGADAAGVRGLLNNAGTLADILNVDPLITERVTELLRP